MTGVIMPPGGTPVSWNIWNCSCAFSFSRLPTFSCKGECQQEAGQGNEQLLFKIPKQFEPAEFLLQKYL